jgi:hypothetical protein
MYQYANVMNDCSKWFNGKRCLSIAEGLRLFQHAEAHDRVWSPGFIGDGRVAIGTGGELDEQTVAVVPFVQLTSGMEEARSISALFCFPHAPR